MNLTVPIRMTLANPFIADAVAAPSRRGTVSRLTASWEHHGASADMGPLAAFNGGASFSGTYAALTLGWPAELNPRTTGAWWQRLVPDDAARVTISLACQTPNVAAVVPLLKAVPVPDGAIEQYGGRETVELRLQDVTGAAARMTDYTVPSVFAATVDPHTVAKSALADIWYVCLYDTGPVDGCLERFPNALMAADDVLIRQQDSLAALAGRRRIRYGDRDGNIVYRVVEDPGTGAPFALNGIFSQFDFEYGPRHIISLTLEGRYLHVTTPFINPYVDLASRIRLLVPRANLDEIVEVHEIRWTANPGGESMTLKCRRQYTL